MKSFLFFRKTLRASDVFDISALNKLPPHSVITVVEKIPSVTSMILQGKILIPEVCSERILI